MNEPGLLKDIINSFTKLKFQAESAVDQIDEESFFAFPSVESSSIAINVKHLGGNLRSRFRDFLTTDGEKPDRDRDSEFEIFEDDTEESLMQLWEDGWEALFEALSQLSNKDLDRTVFIRAEEHSVTQALLRALSHTAYHVGQIVFLAKHYAGDTWEPLFNPPESPR